MTALALTMRPTDGGWAVCLTNGYELVRYRGTFAKRQAACYLQRCARAGGTPSEASLVRRIADVFSTFLCSC
jgi:hypothetical protein